MRQLLAEAVRSGAVGGGGSPSRSAAGSVAMHTPFASPDAGAWSEAYRWHRSLKRGFRALLRVMAMHMPSDSVPAVR